MKKQEKGWRGRRTEKGKRGIKKKVECWKEKDEEQTKRRKKKGKG